MDRRPAQRLSIAIRVLCWTATVATLGAIVAGYAPLLQSVHHVSEVVVHALP